VEPVATRSTIASASPRRGATSTAPEIGITSTAICRVGGGDSQSGEILQPARRGVGRNGRRQAAAAIAKLPDARQLRAGFDQEVDAGDAQVGHAVADELDDVVRPHEQDVEIEVLDASHQRAIVLFEDQPGVTQELHRRVDEAALVGDGEAEAVPHLSVPTGYGRLPAASDSRSRRSRYPPSP
jgi:hypothetical protein